MVTNCGGCGTRFEAKSPRAKWCSDRCRKRAQRGGASITPIKTSEPAQLLVGVHATALAELEDAGRVNTSRGQAALRAAERLDAGSGDTGSSFASLLTAFNAAMDLALSGAKKANDPLDELAQRRLRRVTGA